MQVAVGVGIAAIPATAPPVKMYCCKKMHGAAFYSESHLHACKNAAHLRVQEQQGKHMVKMTLLAAF